MSLKHVGSSLSAVSYWYGLATYGTQYLEHVAVIIIMRYINGRQQRQPWVQLFELMVSDSLGRSRATRDNPNCKIRHCVVHDSWVLFDCLMHNI